MAAAKHEKGVVDIDQENDSGKTAFHVAVINNDLEMVEFMLSRGADVNRKTRYVRESDDLQQATCECANSRYCLHVAHEYGNEMRDDGQNALHLAAKYSSNELVRLLIRKIDDVNATSEDGSTALHYATQNCLMDKSVLELLLDSGADVNARNRECKTAVYLAVKFEKLELVGYLLSRGADVNIPTTKLSTPLFSAIVNCNIALVKLLLENGASIDVENMRNESVLFYALRVVSKNEDRLGLVQTLLDNGVTVDCRNNYGSTGLHVAIQDKDEALAELMIRRGCAINAKDCFDLSALGVAVCTNLHNLAKLLLERGGADASARIKSSSVLEHAVIRRNEAMVDLLLSHGASVNDSDRVLSAACTHKSTRIMQMLIDHGADIDHKDSQARSPLMCVILEKNYPMMRHLVERGAGVNERDCHGNTPLHLLFDNNSCTKEHVVKYLLDKGADVNIENNQGHTALAYMMLSCFTSRVVLTFVKHIALLLAQNRPVNHKIVLQMHSSRVCIGYFNSCQAELLRMREASILDKCSYFDVLTRKHSVLASLFREDNADVEFQHGIHTNALTNYSDTLSKCYRTKRQRFKLLKSGVHVMVTHVFRNIFPLEVVEHLCEYLSNDDIQQLLD